MINLVYRPLYVIFTACLRASFWGLLGFFLYPPFSRIAPRVMTPTLDASLLYSSRAGFISMNVQPFSLHAHITHVCRHDTEGPFFYPLMEPQVSTLNKSIIVSKTHCVSIIIILLKCLSVLS